MTVPVFDALVDQLASARASVAEDELLGALWAQGEDGWLREDARFRPTPWGRWIRSDRFLVNDLLVRALRRERVSELNLTEQLALLDRVTGLPTVWCGGDPRLRFEGGAVRLAPSELSGAPLVERAPNAGQFTTHLPLLTLKAAAASQPAGEWGAGAQAQAVEPLGWLRVRMAGERLNPRMFVSHIRGHSMDDGRSGLVDGALAVFEFSFYDGMAYAPSIATPVVLVRGQLADPDLGSYAVKQWRADGDVARLVSLNPDKDRYPDIVVGAEESDEVRIIATLVRALRPSEYGRAPASERVPGRRDLRSPGALEALHGRLGERLERFFDGQPAGDEGEERALVPWSARLVCLEGAAGGVAIEVGPLVGLPPFARRLRVSGPEWSMVQLASNARHQPLVVPVPPGSGPWRWSVVGFEDDPEADLSALGLDAVDDARPAVFHVDAAGIGRLVTGARVGPEGAWRLLLPPAWVGRAKELVAVESLAGGWGLIALKDGSRSGPETPTLLERLGLAVGEPAPDLRWAPAAPAVWRTSPAGRPYACFLAQDPMILAVTGLSDGLEGDAILLLTGSTGQQRLPLPAVERSWIQLQVAQPGRYLATLTHTRIAVSPVSLAFEVLASWAPLPAATWSARVGEDTVTGRVGERSRAPARDLAGLGAAGPESLSMLAPPGWPVRVLWRGLHAEHLATLHVEPDGTLDVDRLLSVTEARRSRLPVGDLVLDLAELGALCLPHERRPMPHELLRAAAELVRTRGPGLARLRGDLLWTVWLEPIVRLLGYEASPADLESPIDPSGSVNTRLLVSLERDGEEVHPEPARLLVLVDDVTAPLSDDLWRWIDARCWESHVQRAIITDGARFRAHERRSRLPRPPLNLIDATASAEEFQVFLAQFAVGV